MKFADFFQQATAMEEREGYQPFPYQRVFGEAVPENCTLEGPTGVGKSAAVVIRWLYRHHQQLPVATRLVIVEPMRTLVTQLAADARQWTANAGLDYPIFLLKGGHIDRGYIAHAKAPCIIVATLDQIVSRQLMRGYSCSRWSWPIHFALLHNDCEYFCDETQLHGPAYCTSIRLAKLRQRLGTAVKTTVTWSSATLDRRPLEQSGFKDVPHYNVGAEDEAHPILGQKLCRPKPIEAITGNLAEAVITLHQPGSLTLVIRNRIDDAVTLAEQLKALLSEPEVNPSASEPISLLLLHSHFRDHERSQWQDLKPYRGIIVATQVIEAGVDLDARVLITDICPWSSWVQRLGRLGRNGTYPEAIARWIPLTDWTPKALRPYSVEQCRFTQETVMQLKDASIQTLLQIAPPPEAPIHFEPSEKRFRELFNTEPPPAGKDIGIASWIRDSQNCTVSVIWLNAPPEPSYVPSLPEICPVPLYQLQAFGGKGWRQTSEGWSPIDCASIQRVGVVIVLLSKRGGYSTERGWTGNPADIPPPVPREPIPKDDHRSRAHKPVSLAQHSQDTQAQMSALIQAIPETQRIAAFLETCALWHDAGKAHPQFGQAIAGAAYPELLLAKGPFQGRTYERRGFRHEFVSAILAREAGLPFVAQYLIAAHHGRCRVEATPFPWELKVKRWVRGVAPGDLIPTFTLCPEAQIKGGPLNFEHEAFKQHWESGFDHLYTDPNVGPFRLAYLEMLVRNADVLASKLLLPDQGGRHLATVRAILPAPGGLATTLMINLDSQLNPPQETQCQTHHLSGCGLASLGDYLKTLGILRRLPEAKGYWRGGNFYLDCPLGRTELLEHLSQQQHFAPLLSPWNRSSFYWSDKLTAFTTPPLQPHFPGLAGVKATYDEICRDLGIASKTALTPQKNQLLDAATQRIENAEHQAWLSSIFCLEHGTDTAGNPTLKPHYSPLLGAGGLFGNGKELDNCYLQSAQALLTFDPEAAKTRWDASLFGGATVGLDAGILGLGYFPAAGLVNDARPSGVSPYSVAQGKLTTFCSHTDIILLIEGLLLLSSTTVRVLEATTGEEALYPLVVRSLRGTNPVVGATEERKRLREAWLPLWEQPMTASELRHNLLSALRAPMSRSAPDAYDFAQHVATQAHKQGVEHFVRCFFLPRYGQSHYGIMGDVFEPSLGPVTLDAIRHWLRRATHLKPECTPNRFAELIRIASLRFGACIEGRGSNLELLQALGAIEHYMATSPTMRSHISFLPDLGEDWVRAILDEQTTVTAELELALALASRHRPTLRHFWRAQPQGSHWMSPDCWQPSLIDSLIAVQRRARYNENPFAIHPRAPTVCASLDALAAFVDGQCNDERLSAYLWGLSLCQLPPLTFNGSDLGAIRVDPLLRVIKLSGECNNTVFQRLMMNDRKGAIQELQLRLLIQEQPAPGLEYTTGETRRLAAALLFPVSPQQRRQMKRHSSVAHSHRNLDPCS